MRNVDVTKESTGSPFSHGHTVVGTTALRVSTITPSRPLDKGVLLRAPSANSVDIYIGIGSVTADTNATSGGFPLAPGEAVFIPIDDHTKLFVRASASAQDLAWLAI